MNTPADQSAVCNLISPIANQVTVRAQLACSSEIRQILGGGAYPKRLKCPAIKDVGPLCHPVESVSDSLVKNMPTSSLLEVILEGSVSAPPVPRRSLAAGLLPFYSLSPSISMLLKE